MLISARHHSRRRFLTLTGASALVTAANWWPAVEVIGAEAAESYDVVVIGGTPGGIATAVTTARLGRQVALVEYHRHLGAMTASGIGKSDIEHRQMIQGFFREFVDRIKTHYVNQYGAGSKNVKLCKDGYFYEPSVAEKVFDELVDEQQNITVLKHHLFEAAQTESGRVTSVTVRNRDTHKTLTLRAKVFIDATYEGDVYAKAGAEFMQGREGCTDFNEPHAGDIYLDWRNHEKFGGAGKADKHLPAYTYRLCFTSNPGNARPLTAPPPNYDRKRYLGYVEDFTSGRFGKDANLTRIAFSISAVPNEKTDTNMNPRGLGFVFVEENDGYIEADWAGRERICENIRNLTLGLMWFLQHDDVVPAEARALIRKYHLPKDEFVDNGNFPFQLYVREARRLVGEYTLSERNITEQRGLESVRRHKDAIAVGEFPIDSFPMQKRQPGDDRVLEGYLCMLSNITRPYQIPYRIMIPKKLDGIIVPVAASTTHVAFSSIRLEPTWMALGQAAGVAAHLAIQHGVEPRKVPIAELQGILKQQNAVLDFPEKKAKV